MVYETYVPVFSTKPLSGLGSASSDFLWGGVYTQAVGSCPQLGLRLLLRAGVRQRPQPRARLPRDTRDRAAPTGATLQGQVLNYWKAGNAVIQYGTTTGYGSQTANDPIPG